MMLIENREHQTLTSPPSTSVEPARLSLQLRRAWDWVSGALTIIGLASVLDDVIKWAWLAHVIVDVYQSTIGKIFDWVAPWLPFNIPQEWRSEVALGLIVLSAINFGSWGRGDEITGRNMPATFRWMLSAALLDEDEPLASIARWVGLFVVLAAAAHFIHPGFSLGIILAVVFLCIALLLAVVYTLLFSAIAAWRWLAVLAAVFGAIVALNHIWLTFGVPR